MCTDTDVFLLFMYAYEKHKLSCTLIMEDPVAGRTICDIKASAVKMLVGQNNMFEHMFSLAVTLCISSME